MSPILNEAANLMLGDAQVSAVYLGESKVWGRNIEEQQGPQITNSLPVSFTVSTIADINIFGTGFVDGSVIEVDGVARPTIFVRETQVYTAGYMPPDAPGTVIITVRNPDTSESNDWPRPVV
jgi:IPT/TIG domain